MSNIQASSGIAQVLPEEVPRFVDLFCQDVTNVVNGNLDFQTNFNCKIVAVTFSSANIDTPVVHNLGRVSTTFLVTSKNVSADIYNGTNSGTTTTMYLRSSVAPVTVTLVVL